MSNNLENIIGNGSMRLVEALKKIDHNALGILFVVDDKKRLIGTLSDGDIRRWLIKTGDLNAKVFFVMNKTPCYVLENQIDQADNILKKKHISVIPVLDDNLVIVDIIDNKKLPKTNLNEKGGLHGVPVVMMAGGKGTRLYPYTKILPKPLIPIGEKPISELIIDGFCEYGCEEFYLIVNHKKNMIKAYFNEIEKKYTINYIEEKVPLGTGGGVGLLKNIVSDTFILTNCDNLVEEDYKKVYQFHKEQKNIITMIVTMRNISIPYGVVKLGDAGVICSMEEKPTFSFFANTGCYIVEPEVINDIPEETNIGFPEIIEKNINAGKKVGAYPISENAWLDMGEFESLENMREYINKKA